MDPRVHRRFEWKKSHQPSWFTVSYSTSLVEIIRSNLIKLLDVFFPAIYFFCSTLFDAVSPAIGVWRDELYHLNRNSHLKHKKIYQFVDVAAWCLVNGWVMNVQWFFVFRRIVRFRVIRTEQLHRIVGIGEIQLPRFSNGSIQFMAIIHGCDANRCENIENPFRIKIQKKTHTQHSSHAQPNRTENSEIELSSTVFCVPFVCSQLFLFFFLLVFFFLFIFFCFSAVVEELCMSMNSNVNWLLINLFNCMPSSRSCNTHRHTHTNHLKSSNE